MQRRRFLAKVAGMTAGIILPGHLARMTPGEVHAAGGLLVPPAAPVPSATGDPLRGPFMGDGRALTPAGWSAAAARESAAWYPPAPPAAASAAASVIYLTFDDGYVGLAGKVDALNALGVSGTFFLTGQAIYGNPRTVQRLVASGHRLANHSYSHQNLTRLGRTGILGELQSCETAALRTVGVSTKPLMRPPYGAVNFAVRGAAADLGFRSVLWDWDTADWSGTSAAYIERHTGAGVVLMHTQGRNTVAALYDVVPVLAERGYLFGVL